MKGLYKIAVFGLSLLMITALAEAKGMGGKNGFGRDRAGLATVVANLPVQELSAEEEEGLMLMREEEKLARDVYQVLYEHWDLPVFSNISHSEQRHMDAVKALIDKYDLADPIADDSAGCFTDPELQALYDGMVEKGKTSLVDALLVGVTIEDIDIKDLYGLIEQTENSDIKTVYQNLAKGSRNHLRAFSRQLSVNSATYEAQYLSADEIKEIVSSPIERGKVDENGELLKGHRRTTAGKGIVMGRMTKSRFVDVDGDGVCDNRRAHMADSVSGTGIGLMSKSRYKDADGDGVYDNRGTQLARKEKVRGKGHGAGHKGSGFRKCGQSEYNSKRRTEIAGPNFVDTDKDGFCDYSGAKIQKN